MHQLGDLGAIDGVVEARHLCTQCSSKQTGVRGDGAGVVEQLAEAGVDAHRLGAGDRLSLPEAARRP